MLAALWPHILAWAEAAAGWLDARDPAGLPPWAWAGLVVLAALVVGRFGGRLLVGVVQLALVAAAVLVAWQMVRVAAPLRATVPPSCVRTCGAAQTGGPSATGLPLADPGRP